MVDEALVEAAAFAEGGEEAALMGGASLSELARSSSTEFSRGEAGVPSVI